MPEHGLDGDHELVTSSTTSMLAVQKAVDGKKDIVVTLWRPFWANYAFPVKDLEDPKGALGEAEGLHGEGDLSGSDIGCAARTGSSFSE